MTNEDFEKGVLRTEAGDIVYPRLRELLKNPRYALLLLTILHDASRVSANMDALKKALIYGKTQHVSHLVPDMTFFNASAFETPQELSDCVVSHFDADPRVMRLLHAFMGIFGEGGELIDALIPNLFSKQATIDVPNIVEELSDLEWYEAIARNVLHKSLSTIMEVNTAKLLARYPVESGYSDEHAETRDLEAEKKAMEGAQ